MATQKSENLSVDLGALLEDVASSSRPARALLIRDDREGRARAYYRNLKARMSARGLPVFGLSDIRALSGPEPTEGAGTEDQETRLGEKLLASAIGTLSRMQARVGRNPFLLAFQNIGSWDRHAALLVQLLLEMDGKGHKLLPGRTDMLRGLVMAIEDSGRDFEKNPVLSGILHHPLTVTIEPPAEMAGRQAARTPDSAVLKLVRLCQLAHVPLRVQELEGADANRALGLMQRWGIDLSLEENEGQRVVRLTDCVSPYLSDVGTLPPAVLSEYHRKLLGIFEAREGGDCDRAACFHHAVKSGEAGAILRWIDRGLKSMLERGGTEEAADLLKESILVLSGAPEHRDREMELRRTLARIYDSGGRPLQTFETLCACDTRRLDLGDWYLLARASLEAGRPRQALEAVERALNGACLDDGQRRRFKALECERLYLEGSYEKGLKECAVLGTSPMLTDEDRLMVRNVEGRIHLALGRFKRAAKVFKANLKLARSLGSRREEVRAEINIAVSALWLGHYPEARRWLEGAARKAGKWNLFREKALALVNMAVIHHLQKDYRRALDSYLPAMQILTHIDCRDLLARVAVDLGDLYLEIGDTAEAERCLEAARTRLADMQDSHVSGDCAVLSGGIHAARGEFAAALNELDEAEAIFAGRGAVQLRAAAAVRKARVLLALTRLDDAERELEKAAAVADEGGRLEAQVLLGRARLLMERGAPDLMLLEKALKIFSALRYRTGEVECLAILAQVALLRGDGEAAQLHLKKACGLAGEMRCTVPEENIAAFDAMPVQKKLDALRAGLESVGTGSAGAPRGRGRRKAAAAAPVEAVKDELSVKAAPAVPGPDAGDSFYMRLLLAEKVGLCEFKKRIEERCVRQAMVMAEWNVTRAADILGMKRPRLSQIVHELKIKNNSR